MRSFLLAAFSISVATGAFAQTAPDTIRANTSDHQKLVEQQAERIRAYRKAMGLESLAAPQGLEEMKVYVGPSQTAPAEAAPVQPQTVQPGTSRPVTVQTAESLTHIVVKGDTLYGISKRYQVGIDALRSANSIDGSSIRLGQSLIIPVRKEASLSRTKRIVEPVTPSDDVLSVSDLEKPQSYAVVPKDTIYAIAKRTCTSPSALIDLNELSAPDALTPGQMLALPENHCLEH